MDRLDYVSLKRLLQLCLQPFIKWVKLPYEDYIVLADFELVVKMPRNELLQIYQKKHKMKFVI